LKKAIEIIIKKLACHSAVGIIHQHHPAPLFEDKEHAMAK